MRPLAKSDHSRSHLSVLAVLTSTPDLTVEQYTQAFETLRSCPNTYYTVVIVSRTTDTIVGVGSIFMERKFTRNLGRVGHIEDIAVDKSMQGRKLGLRVIQALTGISEATGCYKTILNCSDENIRKSPCCARSPPYRCPPFFQRSTRSAASRRRRTKWHGTTRLPPRPCSRLLYSPLPTCHHLDCDEWTLHSHRIFP